MEDFVRWIKMQHTMNPNGDANMDIVALVAHYRNNHDRAPPRGQRRDRAQNHGLGRVAGRDVGLYKRGGLRYA
jgi:hypothetical protein